MTEDDLRLLIATRCARLSESLAHYTLTEPAIMDDAVHLRDLLTEMIEAFSPSQESAS